MLAETPNRFRKPGLDVSLIRAKQSCVKNYQQETCQRQQTIQFIFARASRLSDPASLPSFSVATAAPVFDWLKS